MRPELKVKFSAKGSNKTQDSASPYGGEGKEEVREAGEEEAVCKASGCRLFEASLFTQGHGCRHKTTSASHAQVSRSFL